MKLTLITKNSGPLTKVLKWQNGKLFKDTSACWLSSGIAKEVEITLLQLAKGLRRVNPNQAFVHGVSGHKEIKIVSEQNFNGQENTITRTQKYFSFPEGEGSAFFDHDPAPGQFPLERGEFMAALASIFPAIGRMEYVWTPSTSSCIYMGDTEITGLTGGMHIYFAVKNAKDLPRFADVLFKRLWLAGHGSIFVTKDGKQLERTIFDKAVFSPERLDFVAGATCEDGLEQRLPHPIHVSGSILDTTLLQDINKKEEAEYERLVKSAKRETLDAAQKLRRQYVEEEIEKLFQDGMSRDGARQVIEHRLGGNLIGKDVLSFDRLGKVSVDEVLRSPEKFDKATLRDPLEPEYGAYKAIFYANRENQRPVIYSHAHGGRTFFLVRQDSPVQFDTVPPKELPEQIFSGVIGEMVDAVAGATETPRELPAAFALAILGACCQKTFVVCPEPGYIEPLNIWAIAALEPGNRKSAVMKLMTAPFLEWESEKMSELAPKIKWAEVERKNLEARISHLRTKFAQADIHKMEKTQKDIQEISESMPDVPRIPKLWVQDVTPEHIGTLMAENDEKMTILSSEGGIFDIMAGRYSRGIPNLDIFLQGHSGDFVKVDRGSRTAIVMHNPVLSMGLSPQPEVLQGLSGKSGFRGRGLLARFLYMLPVSPLGSRKLETYPVPDNLLNSYKALIRALLGVKPLENEQGQKKPYVLKLSKDAWRKWKFHAREIEAGLGEGGRFEHISDWAGKLPGATARIAGLFHCAEHAHEQPWTVAIDEKTMTRAIALADVLSEHALAVFGFMGADPELEGAKKVWRWIERKQLQSFTARDCFEGLKGTFRRMAELNPILNILSERNYIFEKKLEDKNGRGRPRREFLVNLSLVEDWG